MRTEGFAGLAASGAFVAGLVERFWPTLFPAPPDDEPEIGVEAARLKPLADMLARLLPPLRRTVLFALADGTEFRLADCQASQAWAALSAEERKARPAKLSAEHRAAFEVSAGAKAWDAVQAAARGDSAGLLAGQRDTVPAARDAWRAAEAAVKVAAGAGSFTAAPLIEWLDDALRTVSALAPQETAPPPAEEAGAAPQDLNFCAMEDFEPARVAAQVPQLKALMETRAMPRDLVSKADRSEQLEVLLEKILQDRDDLKKAATDLGRDPVKE